MVEDADPEFAELPLSRDRDQFMLELLRELSGVLEEIVGLDDAEGFISMVGNRLGRTMNAEYQSALGTDELTIEEVAQALVDLKARIDGGFTIEEVSGNQIVLVNTACPFGNYVKNRTSLCMMTSNIFGRIAANNRGYANVSIPEAIARGDRQCRVVISLDRPLPHTRDPNSREYYAD